MRTLVIGDIHGCLTALDTLLARVALTSEDWLITLGDYVDRGPDSRGVLERLIQLQGTGRLIPLRGNHDEMMVSARQDHGLHFWLVFGGIETLESYGEADPPRGSLQTVPEKHWEFLESLRDYHETPSHIFVHATVAPDRPLHEQTGDSLRWDKLDGAISHCSGKIVVCGHTRQTSGRPWNLKSTICIDTGAYEPDGWLTCLDVDGGHYWQANERRQWREGNL